MELLRFNSLPATSPLRTDDFQAEHPSEEPNTDTTDNTMIEHTLVLQNPSNTSTRPEAIKSCSDVSNVFSSLDFGKFLSKEFPSSNPFLSKDMSLASFDVPALLKSKDTISNIFSSSDWQMKLSKLEDLPPSKPVQIPSIIVTSGSDDDSAEANSTKESLQAILTSRDWMPSKSLGPHVDVSFDREMMVRRDSSSGISIKSDLSAALAPPKTNWDDLFMSQLQLMPPSASPVREASHPMARQAEMDYEPSLAPPELEEEEVLAVAPVVEQVPAPAAPTGGKKKRKRKPRKKVVPEVKEFVVPTQNDVLLGRGGRSNHHPGNKRYREEVKNMRDWYASIGENKEEKTRLSQTLVDYVHDYNGRFLEKDKNGRWYVVPNIVARRKASQALREDDDPEKRAAKRARFLMKRAALRGTAD